VIEIPAGAELKLMFPVPSRFSFTDTTSNTGNFALEAATPEGTGGMAD
jgi:hypothetical protein